jgi:hypothetical protein
MGSHSQHQSKADHNQLFLSAIAELEFPDWTAVVIFYRAVHLVEMVFAMDGIHGKTHQDRHELLLDKYPEILRDFRPLFNYSLLARYGFKPINGKRDIPLLVERLRSLENYVGLEIAARTKSD